MKLDISKVNQSIYDSERNLRLPSEMSERLAEDIGIMIGDGHIGRYKYGHKTDYSIYVSGNAGPDREYIINHVVPLKYEIYNLKFPVSFVGKNKSEIRLKICSKGLVEFYDKVIGLKVNKKIEIGIPGHIFLDKICLSACLRGILDTDFSLGFKKKEKYPVFHLKTCSSTLAKDCQRGFLALGIKGNVYLNKKEVHSVTGREFTTNYFFINGRKNLRLVMERVGSNNPRIIGKIEKWAHWDSNPGPIAHP